MRILYNLVLFIVMVLYAPVHLIRLCFSNKYRKSTFARLGFQKIPVLDKGRPSYWIHSVSVGETQVARTLTKEILAREPGAQIVISTITETGQAVARSIEGASGTFYYPLDYSFLASSMLNKIHPTAVFIVETDLWFNFLDRCRSRDIPVFLVNGKISKTTAKRYRQFPRLAQKLLKPFHHFFVQSETYKDRFSDSGIVQDRLTVCGNVKLDSKPPLIEEGQKESFFKLSGLSADCPIITFGSTHFGEEELSVKVFNELSEKYPTVQFVLVPRHPERFNGIADMLRKQDVDFNRLSEPPENPKRFLLVDQMGVLMKFYSISTIGVVAGTFIPEIGGHNILEPSFYGKPFVYGPWIFKQPGFHQINLEFKAGVQCKPEELSSELEKLLSSPELCDEYGRKGLEALTVSSGATTKILDEVYRNLSKNV